MKLIRQLAFVSATSCVVAMLMACSAAPPMGAVQPAWQELPALKKYFDEVGTDGTLLIHDLKKNVAIVYNPARARTGFVPASTFKIANSLIAIETGVVKDIDNEKFKFSGEPFKVRGKPFLPQQCNEDVTLRTAFKVSCVPVYQDVARRVGMERYRKILGSLGYGAGDLGAERVDWFWLEGNYKVSAEQQVQFLTRLYQGKLPFSARSIEL